MKRILAALAFLAVAASIAWSQSDPGFVYGFTPTPAQWNSYFSGKLDVANVGPILGGHADGINCNVGADTQFAIYSPTPTWALDGVAYALTTGSGSGVSAGIYTQPSGAGQLVVGSLALPSYSGVNNFAGATVTSFGGFGIGSGASYQLNYPVLYFHVATPQGSACILNVYFYIRPLP